MISRNNSRLMIALLSGLILTSSAQASIHSWMAGFIGATMLAPQAPIDKIANLILSKANFAQKTSTAIRVVAGVLVYLMTVGVVEKFSSATIKFLEKDKEIVEHHYYHDHDADQKKPTKC